MICPPPAVEVAAAPLFRGYGSLSESRIQTRIQSRIQTPRSQARIDAPNGWGWEGWGLQKQRRERSTDAEVAQLAATAHRSSSDSGAAANNVTISGHLSHIRNETRTLKQCPIRVRPPKCRETLPLSMLMDFSKILPLMRPLVAMVGVEPTTATPLADR